MPPAFGIALEAMRDTVRDAMENIMAGDRRIPILAPDDRLTFRLVGEPAWRRQERRARARRYVRLSVRKAGR